MKPAMHIILIAGAIAALLLLFAFAGPAAWQLIYDAGLRSVFSPATLAVCILVGASAYIGSVSARAHARSIEPIDIEPGIRVLLNVKDDPLLSLRAQIVLSALAGEFDDGIPQRGEINITPYDEPDAADALIAEFSEVNGLLNDHGVPRHRVAAETNQQVLLSTAERVQILLDDLAAFSIAEGIEPVQNPPSPTT